MSIETRVVDAEAGLAEALALLRAGEALAFPTDTVYGVGADGLNPSAVARLYAVKQRPLTQAIPLLLGDLADLELVASVVTPQARLLAERLWPGALTLVLPAASHLPAELLAGGTTVAVRLPDHKLVRRLCRELGRPLAVTSANLHGGPNPQTAVAVLAELGGRLPLILDGGPTPGDIPSTIVDLASPEPRILRAGVIDPVQIMALLSEG
jgi:L-threonylcarbamoyladenylate synthase